MFYDETVAGSTGLLEHRCTSLIDLNTQQSVLSLQTSSLFSAVLTNNGKIYWWLVSDHCTIIFRQWIPTTDVGFFLLFHDYAIVVGRVP